MHQLVLNVRCRQLCQASSLWHIECLWDLLGDERSVQLLLRGLGLGDRAGLGEFQLLLNSGWSQEILGRRQLGDVWPWLAATLNWTGGTPNF